MAEVIRMPRMSDTMEEGVVVSWLKKEGDSVKPGDVLAEIETDKATMDFESLWEGTLLHIGAPLGKAIPVDGLIAVIGKPGENYQDLLSGGGRTNGSTAAGKPAEAPPTAPPAGSPAPTVEADHGERVKASPLAKVMAKDSGVDISKVAGTGEAGRIIKRDVEAYLQHAPAPSSVAPVAPATGVITESFTDFPISQMRKTIARRLAESKFTSPHFYLGIEVNMDNAVQARSNILAMSNIKISYNDLVVKACALALKQHPAVNSSWLGDRIRQNHHVHVGVAVAVDDGLLVPVIRSTDSKSIQQINTEVKTLAQKAKDRKLTPEEMQGNTFTISNLGMFGIEEFTAIINPPDACILAVGGIMEKPIVKNGVLKVGQVMKLTLSCDHRVVDGATAARFLQTLKQFLEEPLMMLV